MVCSVIYHLKHILTGCRIHGGSFIVGSASGAGLDGSKLAIATNSIVAVIQYRLGAVGLNIMFLVSPGSSLFQFGFLPPTGQSNLAAKDVVTALSFLQTVVPSFGGCPSKITIAGQSSGATMVRTLLAVPSVSSLFQSGILQSDAMVNYRSDDVLFLLTFGINRTLGSSNLGLKIPSRSISTLILRALQVTLPA